MLTEDRSYARQVMVLILIIVCIWAVSTGIMHALASHSIYDTDINLYRAQSFIGKSFVLTEFYMINDGLDDTEFYLKIFINDRYEGRSDYIYMSSHQTGTYGVIIPIQEFDKSVNIVMARALVDGDAWEENNIVKSYVSSEVKV